MKTVRINNFSGWYKATEIVKTSHSQHKEHVESISSVIFQILIIPLTDCI